MFNGSLGEVLWQLMFHFLHWVTQQLDKCRQTSEGFQDCLASGSLILWTYAVEDRRFLSFFLITLSSDRRPFISRRIKEHCRWLYILPPIEFSAVAIMALRIVLISQCFTVWWCDAHTGATWWFDILHMPMCCAFTLHSPVFWLQNQFSKHPSGRRSFGSSLDHHRLPRWGREGYQATW